MAGAVEEPGLPQELRQKTGLWGQESLNIRYLDPLGEGLLCPTCLKVAVPTGPFGKSTYFTHPPDP